MRDIRRLDLNLLKVLHALIEERSVTKAAARLGLTQPAVSGMLARLRDAFEDPLFVRSRGGMLPTARALELASPVRRLLSEIEGLLQPPGFEPALADRTLTIAASDYALSVLATPLISALRDAAPGIRLSVRPLSTATIASELATGRIDLALVAAGVVEAAHLHHQRLFEEEYVCLMREDHPAAAEAWSLELFCSLDHALVAFDGGFEGATDRALAELGRSRRVVLSVASFLILPAILRATDFVAVAPSRLVSEVCGVAHREPPLAIPGFGVSAVWHERSHRDPALSWARSLVFTISEEVGKLDLRNRTSAPRERLL